MEQKIVIMGVAGCGKTTIGERLASALNCSYIDGDDLHPANNIAKMSAGMPLTDEDRWPWLGAVGKVISDSRETVIVGCSALKRSYRDKIRQTAGSEICFVHLVGSRELIAERMGSREGHFMPGKLIDSQFATLEVPDDDEQSISVDISQSPEKMIPKILNQLKGESE